MANRNSMPEDLAGSANEAPLAVDLNGTLVATDTLHEGCVAALRSAPLSAAQLFGALREGRAPFKRQVARRVGAAAFGPAMLPCNEPCGFRAVARTWAKALRLEHWAKNLLVFVAPVLAHEAASPGTMAQALVLFLCMGLLASATYVVNDVFDLAADRAHPIKRRRPFAAGEIPVRHGVIAAAGLIGTAFALSLALPLGCTVALLAYLAVTLAYSLALKRMPVVDVIVLAGLFTLRIVAGGCLVPFGVSPWLLTFAMLFFLGLAVVKRYAELERGVRDGGEAFEARGYTAKDLPLLLATGIGSGLGAIVIFTIYLINEQYPQAMYRHPEVLWAMMPILLLWTLRLWHLAVHGRMDEDPVVFALKDRVSLWLGALVAAVLIGASL